MLYYNEYWVITMPLTKEEFLYFLDKGFITTYDNIEIKDLIQKIDNDFSTEIVMAWHINNYFVYAKKMINNTNIVLS